MEPSTNNVPATFGDSMDENDYTKLMDENLDMSRLLTEQEIKIKDYEEKINKMNEDISKLQNIILKNLSFEKKPETEDEPEEKSFNELYDEAIKENIKG